MVINEAVAEQRITGYITSQFTRSSGPVPYTLRVFNKVKWVFRLSVSLPRIIVIIAFMLVRLQGLESVVGLGLAFGLDLRLVSGLYKVAILSCNCEATQTRCRYLFT